MNQFPQAPEYALMAVSTFFRKFAEIFAAQGAPQVWLIPVRWCTLTGEYLREFSKKFETVLIGFSEAGEKLIHEKNQKLKIS
jgi:hypothetical protein